MAELRVSEVTVDSGHEDVKLSREGEVALRIRQGSDEVLIGRDGAPVLAAAILSWSKSGELPSSVEEGD